MEFLEEDGFDQFELPGQLVGDQIRLKQVLVNLTKNALKFSPKKDIFIKASFNNLEHKLEVQI